MRTSKPCAGKINAIRGRKWLKAPKVCGHGRGNRSAGGIDAVAGGSPGISLVWRLAVDAPAEWPAIQKI
jgi:hypothetical protein